MLNEDSIPDYLKEVRLVLLSKNGKIQASMAISDPSQSYLKL